MGELGSWGWGVLALAALLLGMAKTGVPGLGILAVPLVAWVMPARASTGLLLPMLLLADCFAVAHYRRHAAWPHLLRLLPWTLAGIVLGCVALGRIDDARLRPLIGGVVLAMLGVQAWRQWRAGGVVPEPPGHWLFAAGMGLLAGATTMLANAAGPVMILYLLAMRLPKLEFLGTSAWFFLLVNGLKVPFSVGLGLITRESLVVNLVLVPVIITGAMLGLPVARRLPERGFTLAAQLLTVLAALKLLV
ncbi:MAG: sulfite exporter TauE/SafE family protein [Lentisphaeria bacterium]